jgi:hypothetical protein
MGDKARGTGLIYLYELTPVMLLAAAAAQRRRRIGGMRRPPSSLWRGEVERGGSNRGTIG